MVTTFLGAATTCGIMMKQKIAATRTPTILFPCITVLLPSKYSRVNDPAYRREPSCDPTRFICPDKE
ncbi:MAG: hypothetical protein WCP21_24670, partial [Armatimonadota bacterium]